LNESCDIDEIEDNIEYKRVEREDMKHMKMTIKMEKGDLLDNKYFDQ
jgi:hypothetical protein